MVVQRWRGRGVLGGVMQVGIRILCIEGFVWGVNGVFRGGRSGLQSRYSRCGLRYGSDVLSYGGIGLGFRSEWCISRCRCY